jgi:hypothetical protein
MLNWMKRRGPITYLPRERDVALRPVVAGKYLLLYAYLQNRYADTVVLTFAQIESLLGFPLPDQARLNRQWWTNAAATAPGGDYTDSWLLARRVATPNLLARIVAFERRAPDDPIR